MNRQTLVKGLLSLSAISLMTGCVDDNYDLTDIDTTSRFTVDDLTVPIKLSKVKLENVIDLDDNENIEKVSDGKSEYYAIIKDGKINTSEFSLGGIHVDQPTFQPSIFSVQLPGAGNVPGVQIDLPAIDLPSIPLQDYEFSMQNVDKALKVLRNIKTAQPIKIQVELSVPQELVGVNNSISFQNLEIQLPWGLMTDMTGYEKETGLLKIAELAVDAQGKAILTIEANGLDLEDKGTVENGNLGIEGKVGILAAQIKISVKDVTLPSSIDIRADYSVSSFDLASFSGKIDYNMDDISIDPISLSGLPDFLDSPETNLVIAAPQILVSLNNPVGKYGLKGSGVIRLVSLFNNGKAIERYSDPFTLEGNQTNLAFCTPEGGDYTDVPFEGLHYVLSSVDGNSGSENVDGLPKSIQVNIQDINFAGEVVDFPLGNIGTANGDYAFKAPLGFGPGSIVIYETTVDGWSSDTLDDVNINKVKVNAKCTTNLPVSVQLSVTPIDKYGKEIAVSEESGMFEVSAKANGQPVFLEIESKGTPITNLDGVKLRAVVTQYSEDNQNPLGPDLEIFLDDIRVTVDGYYETDF